jgi:hypothetical protein
MVRKSTQKPEATETFPPEGGAKPAGDLGLNSVIDAAENAAAPPPEQSLEPPPLQPPNKPFTIADCYADESEPPPTPPQKYTALRHSGVLPKSAFRILPREEGKKNILNMVAMPYGESEPGQGFSFPVPKGLIKPIAEQCPTLTVKRYEARVAVDAVGNPSIVEVPFDPLLNKNGERNRQTLLDTIKIAESKAIIAVKMIGGAWTYVDAPNFEAKIPAQKQGELVDLTYASEFVNDMEHTTLRKFRRKV